MRSGPMATTVVVNDRMQNGFINAMSAWLASALTSLKHSSLT